MNHKACWPFLVGDTLAVGMTAMTPERTTFELAVLGFSLVMTLAPIANQVAGWLSQWLLVEDAT